MSKKIMIVAFAMALTIGLLAGPAHARLTVDGSTSYTFQSVDATGFTMVLMSTGNADGQAQNQDDGCDKQQVPDGDEQETPSGVCYDPIRIGGSGT